MPQIIASVVVSAHEIAHSHPGTSSQIPFAQIRMGDAHVKAMQQAFDSSTSPLTLMCPMSLETCSSTSVLPNLNSISLLRATALPADFPERTITPASRFAYRIVCLSSAASFRACPGSHMSDAVHLQTTSKLTVTYLGNESSFHPRNLLVGLVQEDSHLLMVLFQYRTSLRCSAHIVEEAINLGFANPAR